MTEVHAEQRGVAAAREFGRTQDRAVAPEHDHDLEVVLRDVVAEDRDRREIGCRGEQVAVLVGREHGGEPGVEQLAADLDPGLERIGSAGVRDDEDVPFCRQRNSCAASGDWARRRDQGRASIALSHSGGLAPTPDRQPEQILLIAVAAEHWGGDDSGGRAARASQAAHRTPD